MEIKYRTKAESKKEQEEAFLKLTPSERVVAFINLCYEMKAFPSKTNETEKDKGNFVIKLYKDEGWSIG